MVPNREKDKELRADELKVDEIFDSISQVQIKASAGFKDRILARASVPVRSSRRSQFWTGMTTASLAFALVGVSLSVWLNKNVFVAGVSQQVALRLDVASHSKGSQCKMEVELPSGVRFHSDEYPEVASRSFLSIPCKSSGVSSGSVVASSIPIVLEGTEEGLKRIVIRFVGNDQNVISKATYRIRFKKEAQTV